MWGMGATKKKAVPQVLKVTAGLGFEVQGLELIGFRAQAFSGFSENVFCWPLLQVALALTWPQPKAI